MTETGEPAFAVPANEPIHSGATGMTLRDYFAAKAMQAYLTTDDANKVTLSTIAECSYDIADVMLEARK